MEPHASHSTAHSCCDPFSDAFVVDRHCVCRPAAAVRLVSSTAPRFGPSGSPGKSIRGALAASNREEAEMLARCAYATVSQLRQQYGMIGSPMFNNFLIHLGVKKRGYCYEWTEDLLVALDALKLTSLELHWAETHARTWRENNALVVTAKGQPFQRGIILECWEDFGHLRWGPILGQRDPYVENSAYAGFVRAARATAPNVLPTNHP